ncbi:MAG: desulfoferrodoxin [Patescibacteria group bacterium]
MTKQNQIYKCNVCGNIVEVLHAGEGELVCCGQPMELLTEKKEDEGHEKHVPVIEKTADGVLVKIGSIPHPMEEAHYIEWIELLAGGTIYRKFLKPGDTPEAKFCVKAENVSAKEYCNIHGLWST